MNLLLESIVTNGLVFDALGVIGLGLLALAALRLVKNDKSWGGSMMGYGAVALLVARLYVLTAPHFVDIDFLHADRPGWHRHDRRSADAVPDLRAGRRCLGALGS